MQAGSCVAPGNRLRGSGAKRDAATVNLIAPRVGDLGIRASLEVFPRAVGTELVFPAPNGGTLSDMTLTAVIRRMNECDGTRMRGS
jgi:hypothetical protein